MLSRGSIRHPVILLSCPRRHRPHAVRKIPWTSWDPPLVSQWTQAPILSGGSLGHLRISLHVSLTQLPISLIPRPHPTVRHLQYGKTGRAWSSRTQPPMLSRGSLGHPGILPWCPLGHRPPYCPEDLCLRGHQGRI